MRGHITSIVWYAAGFVLAVALFALWIGNPYLDTSVRDFSLNSTGLV